MKEVYKKILIAICVLVIFGGVVILYLNDSKNNINDNTNGSASNSDVVSDYSSDDLDIDEEGAYVIDLENPTSGSGVEVSDGMIKISAGGTYLLKGKYSGTIYIDSEEDVHIILAGVDITSTASCIYAYNGDLVITLKDGSSNVLTDGDSRSGEDDAVIYCKDDLTINGTGSIVINGNCADGIVSNDVLKLIDGSYEIKSADDGIRGSDAVMISSGTYNISSNGDGIKASNDTDSSLGYIVIDGGIFNINSQGDGIQAETQLVINNGEFNIKTTGNDDENSTKCLKGGTNIEINNGVFNLNASDDAIHCDGDIKINNGDININASDDAIHGDGLVEINGSTIDISAHEGVEGTYIKINSGDINISASDDAINAANKSTAYSVCIEINGGNITIKMGQGDTDAVDSNGNIYMNGGTINITAQSPFDYEGVAEYNGGTIIVNGATVNTITNQMMGGGMMNGAMPEDGAMGGNPGNMGGPRGGR